jgi:DNA mismatch repair protein MutS2
VLLDEVGSGTDPVEGGALGAAVIDHFRKRGAIVIATTHDDALKSYGATTEGVAVAAFGFNAETFAPTYSLVYGAPGRSLALEVARRLGMPAGVIADAERRRSGRESLLARTSRASIRSCRSSNRKKRQLRDQQTGLDTQRRSLLDRETRLAEREAVTQEAPGRQADRAIARSPARSRRRRHTPQNQGGGTRGPCRETRGRTPALSTGDVGSLRAEARAALGDIETSTLGAQTGAPAAAALDEAALAGRSRLDPVLQREAIVRGINGQQVDVEVRGKRMRVQLSALRKPGKANAAANEGGSGARKARVPAAATTSTSLAAHTRDLVLIGSTVDDAVPRVEKALDDAIVADERRLRLVHGHGTGRLRDALRAFVRQHPLVASVAPAADNEGGDGATIVELKD